MNKLYFIANILFTLLNGSIYANVYYVAPNGSDSNAGSINEPLKSVQKAQEMVSAGDTVYIRGGENVITESDISHVENSLFACITYLDKSGQPGKRINYWAYAGETPKFDFSAVKPVNQRVVGIWVEGDYIHIKGLEMTGVQVTIATHTESYCIYSWGNHNVFEQISMHDNVGTGLRHRDGGNNLFKNCDAYRNHDNVSENKKGGNTDGFGCHPKKGGTGNRFVGCRAWFNSDDGYDVLGAAESVMFDSCYAMYNGYSPSFESLADGNGFKAGGYGSTTVDKLPNPIPSHTIRFCVAVRNKANGFYSNHHIAGSHWYNNSAYRNTRNYRMMNRLDDNVSDVDGYDHVMRNNLGYKGGTEIDWVDYDKCDIAYNSFDLDINLSDEDFLSLDENLLTAPREADGSLPNNDFMRLDPNSDVIDKGEDIGFKFSGQAPDLGAFEYVKEVISGVAPSQQKFESVVLYPNPCNDRLFIRGIDVQEVECYDLLGRRHPVSFTKNVVYIEYLIGGIYTISLISKTGDKYIRMFNKL